MRSFFVSPRSPRLTGSEKIRNTRRAKKRIAVEHVIANLKKYNILASVYWNSKENYYARGLFGFCGIIEVIMAFSTIA